MPAGPVRRPATIQRSRSQMVDLVNDELVQRNITLLSGETCRDDMRVVAAPMSKACLKTRNELAKADSGAAGVSRGHKYRFSNSNRDGKDRTMRNKEEPSTNSLRGNHSSTEETTGSLSRPGLTATAQVEQPALSLFQMETSLMEAVVEPANIERAWKQVKANRGAPGPDGITIAKFPDWYRLHWSTVRQQLLD